jgi:MFS family permease
VSSCPIFLSGFTNLFLAVSLPTVLIQSVGLTEKLARLLAACNSVSYLLFSFISIPNIEKWGRRNMMLYASLGQGCCYLLITILLRFNEKDGYAHQNEVASASIAFFFLYYVFFGIGWQGVPWLYPTGKRTHSYWHIGRPTDLFQKSTLSQCVQRVPLWELQRTGL